MESNPRPKKQKVGSQAVSAQAAKPGANDFKKDARKPINSTLLLAIARTQALGKVTGSFIVQDTTQRDLGIRVSKHKTAFFIVSKIGRLTPKRWVLGHFPDMDWEGAVAEGSKYRKLLRLGKNPKETEALEKQEEQRKIAEILLASRLFREVFQTFIKIKKTTPDEPEPAPTDKKKKKKRTKSEIDRDYVAGLLTETRLWKTPFNEVNFDVIEESLWPIFTDKLATGWKCYRYCRAAFRVEAQKQKMALVDPFDTWLNIKNPPKVQGRTSRLDLTEEQAGKWVKALFQLRQSDNYHHRVMADDLVCILFWGTRKGETAKITEGDVDFNKLHVEIRAETTKGKRLHLMPLTPWIAGMLRDRIADNKANNRDYQLIFPSIHHGKSLAEHRTALDIINDAADLHSNKLVAAMKAPPSTKAEIEAAQKARRKSKNKSAVVAVNVPQYQRINLTAHDLRRTFASELAVASEFNVALVKKGLNHAESENQVTLQYIAELAKVAALRKLYIDWELRLLAMAGLSKASHADQLIQAIKDTPDLREPILARLLAFKVQADPLPIEAETLVMNVMADSTQRQKVVAALMTA